MPDYFDRLLARHVPGLPAAYGERDGTDGRPDTPVRARPRLPGPFERVEALRDGLPGPDGDDPFPPAAPRPVVHREERLRHEREVRTEHHTVVRTEPAPRGEEPRTSAVR
ncbi:MAG TPA: hypothetical protein VE546_10955, partial [Streptomyces sp.]|nr:hypothetical protein [Streptomyces sp.]